MSARNLTSTVEKFEIGSIPRIFSKKIGNQYPCSPWWCWIFSRFFEEVSLKLYQNRHAVIPGLVIWNSTLVPFSQMIRRHDSQIQEVSRIGYRENKETISLWIFCIRTQRLSANEWWAMGLMERQVWPQGMDWEMEIAKSDLNILSVFRSQPIWMVQTGPDRSVRRIWWKTARDLIWIVTWRDSGRELLWSLSCDVFRAFQCFQGV